MPVGILEIKKKNHTHNTCYVVEILVVEMTSLEMSGFFTSTMSVWELVQNRGRGGGDKQKETERTSENERERDLTELAGFLYCAMPKAKCTSIFFRHSINNLLIYIYQNWVIGYCK